MANCVAVIKNADFYQVHHLLSLSTSMDYVALNPHPLGSMSAFGYIENLA